METTGVLSTLLGITAFDITSASTEDGVGAEAAGVSDLKVSVFSVVGAGATGRLAMAAARSIEAGLDGVGVKNDVVSSKNVFAAFSGAGVKVITLF